MDAAKLIKIVSNIAVVSLKSFCGLNMSPHKIADFMGLINIKSTFVVIACYMTAPLYELRDMLECALRRKTFFIIHLALFLLGCIVALFFTLAEGYFYFVVVEAVTVFCSGGFFALFFNILISFLSLLLIMFLLSLLPPLCYFSLFLALLRGIILAFYIKAAFKLFSLVALALLIPFIVQALISVFLIILCSCEGLAGRGIRCRTVKYIMLLIIIAALSLALTVVVFILVRPLVRL